MKSLKFAIPILIAISILVTSQVVLGNPTPNNANSSVHLTSAVQIQASIDDGINIEQGVVEANPLNNDQPSQYILANQSQPLVLTDQFVSKQWALTSIQISSLWQITTGSQDIVVAILDTGIDKNHEDLGGQIKAEVNFTDAPTPDDIYGHGTHIAGIIAAKNNSIGIVGLAPGCRLLNVKVADDRGRCQVSDLVEGIIWAVDNGANVINISIEIKESSQDLEEAINYAWNHGAVVIAAAGNNGSQSPVYPASYENCIAVAAFKENNSLAPLSNRGDWINLAAPGFQIYSTLPGSNYGFETGTSFAAAHVSGIAALLFTKVTDTNGNGHLNDEVLAMIETGCQETGISGVGRGYIDAAKVVV